MMNTTLFIQTSIYEQYIHSIRHRNQKGLVELRLKADVTSGREKNELKAKINKAEEATEVMKIARKSMAKFMASFETGVTHL